jgi:hypothetical protein
MVLAVSVLVYYLNPSPVSLGPALTAGWIVLTVGGGTFVVVRQIRERVAEYRGAADRQVVGLETLANLLGVVAVVFAATYFHLAHSSGQIDGIRTHTDALYFSMTILSTVGFGDIHATGQLARVIVTIQMLFDLVFVASIIGLVVSGIATRSAGEDARRPSQRS